jgi:high affinity Mn2+ porin
MKTKKWKLLIWIILLNQYLIFSQQNNDSINKIEKWSYHFQFTGIMQGHSTFHALYSGQNSLSTEQESAFSITSTLFLGRKLWKGASLYFNPEIAGGKGIGNTLGIAGFTNGECYRIGDPTPALYIARAFIRQHIAIGKNDSQKLDGDINQLGGEQIPTSRITITAGRFSIADVYDCNSYSHDPRTQFMNWGLMSNGAWDYPANTRGYTYGFILELIKPTWAIRVSETMVPQRANASVMDENISKARGETIELEKDFKIKGHPGVIRILAYRNLSRAGNYENTISLYKSGVDTSLNVNTLTTYGAQKYGFGINAEQELTANLGIFLRAGWNDGKTASWAFTEIDQSASIGINIKGVKWKRPNDVIGIAGLINGISTQHWDFLNFGGYGFIIGDGKLTHYGAETIGEVYYSIQLAKSLWFSMDYQYVQNPAYNRDRGPVNVWGARAHVKF